MSPVKRHIDKMAKRPKAKVITYGNIWTRQLKFEKAGQMKKGHKHEFDHLHFLVRGRVKINVYDRKDQDTVVYSGEYNAPAWLKVPAEHFHDIVALEDNSEGYCIQAITNPEGEVEGTDYANDLDWMAIVEAYGVHDEDQKS